jgi:SAM-dependent methyltransferase
MAGSLSFDPAAEFYDRTRVTDAASLAPAIDLLDDVLPDGAVLEIGVGTGALAVPLTTRGRPVVGLDLSTAMLAKLREKDPDRTIPVAAGDATRLPFGSGSFRGAYCRWVLHLIADWHVAVRELCRVVDRGGVVVVEPGGYSGEWRSVWLRFVQQLGPVAEPLGLDVRGGYVDLDEAFTAAGGRLREIATTPASVDSSLERFFEETLARSYSWTWRVPPDDLRRAVEVVRPWAVEQYGPDLSRPFASDAPHRWRVYDLGG